MDDYIQVAKSEQVKENFAISVTIENKPVAIFRYKGQLYALHDSCPHQNAPISEGYVDEGYAVCPHHGWKFRLESGSFSHNDLIKIQTYNVKEKDGLIYIHQEIK
jgi:NAD(P)H-dependent nitrite reductase small subunit